MVRKRDTSDIKSSKAKGITAKKIGRNAPDGWIVRRTPSPAGVNVTLSTGEKKSLRKSEHRITVPVSESLAKRLGFEEVIRPTKKADAPLEIVATLPPMHPGEVLREEFLEPMGLSAGKVAKACDVPRTRIERIVAEETAITADTALRLGRYFGIDPRFWLNLQARFDLEVAEASAGKALDGIKPFQAA